MKYFILIPVLLSGLLSGLLLPAHSTMTTSHQQTGEPMGWTPDEVAKLINECGKRTTRMVLQLYNYGFLETDTEYVIDKNGGLKSEQSKVFEVSPITIGGFHRMWIHVQISENGVPLSPEKVARERERATMQIRKLEQQAAAGQRPKTTPFKPNFTSYGIRVERHGKLSKGIFFIHPTDFLESHDFFAPQRVSVAGRKAILLNFRPRPGYVYDKTNVPFPEGVDAFGRVMSALGGRIWIDALDKVIVRLEAKPLRELSEPDAVPNIAPDPNIPLWFEFTRLPDGTWAQSVSGYNSYGREDVFLKTPASRSLTFSDFKLFKATGDIEKLEALPPKKP